MADRAFQHQTVVITGASAGIGAAAARRFAAQGAHLVLAARGEEALGALAEELAVSGAETLVVPTDVSDHAACAALVERAVERFGGLDVLVNNAGLHLRGDYAGYEADGLAAMVDVNLRAPIVLSRLALPHLEASPRGAIVNVASLAGYLPLPGAAVYGATKAGLRSWSRAIADELAGRGVTVSLVSPGPVDTGFLMGDIEHVADAAFAQPMSTAGEIADLVVSCALDGAVERRKPAVSGVLANLVYMMPWLGRAVRPALERRGRRAKRFYLNRERNRP